MFFILSKLIGLFLNPLVWIVVLLLFVLWVKKSRVQKKLLIITVLITVFFSNKMVFNAVLRMWDPPAVADEKLHAPYDYGIVLGGIAWFDTKTKHVNFMQSSDRIWQAVRLYQTGKIKKILISGGAASFFTEYEVESLMLKQFLLDIGIPESDIITEEKSRNTRENALYTKELLPTDKNYKFLLITSATHMKRSNLCFRKVGLICDLYPVDFNSGRKEFRIDELLVPNPQTLFYWNAFIHEVFGLVSYKLMGYI